MPPTYGPFRNIREYKVNIKNTQLVRMFYGTFEGGKVMFVVKWPNKFISSIWMGYVYLRYKEVR